MRDATPVSRAPELGLLADFRLLIGLFIALRLMLAMVYQPYILDRWDAAGESNPVERGLTTFGDFRYYFQFARLSDHGLLPYRDYWHEFPPVWTTLYLGVYRLLAARGPVDFTVWATALGLILLAVDAGNLILLRRLAARLHGEPAALALAWAYALLAAPLITAWWTFEALVLFAILAALAGLVEGRFDRSAAATVIGALTKLTPLLILPAVWRFFPARRALRFTAITLLLVGAALALIAGWGGALGRASLAAQPNKASYQTVWAILDGNWRTGSFSGPAVRLDPATAYQPLGNPAVIPGWLRLIPFAVAGLFVYTRPLRHDARGIVAFVSLTFALFMLWAQGWSPQWAVTLTPILLLNFPSRDGILACLLLSALSFVEYPVLFMRTGDTGGAITGALALPYVAVILMRTGLLIGLAVALYRRAREADDGPAG